MTNTLWFEKDGFTYAKGFINQNGFSVYVLPGYEGLLRETLGATLGNYRLESTTTLPGRTRCPEGP
jgi:hypothetical protein